jgi:hypothetical protein
MDNFVELAVYCFLAYAVGNMVVSAVNLVHAQKTDELNRIKRRLDDIIHRVQPEKVKDTIYWYDVDANLFLGQGRTQEEVIESVRQRFPTHLFILPNDDVVTASTNWIPKNVANLTELKKLVNE